MTLSAGKATNADGGAVLVGDQTITFRDCVLTGNQATGSSWRC